MLKSSGGCALAVLTLSECHWYCTLFKKKKIIISHVVEKIDSLTAKEKKILDLPKMKRHWSPCWRLNGKGSQGVEVLTELSLQGGPLRKVLLEAKTPLSIHEHRLLSLNTEPRVCWVRELRQPGQRYPGSTGKLSTAAVPAGGTLGKYSRGVGWVWWWCLCCFNDTCVQRPAQLSSISHQSDFHGTDIA